MATGRVEFTGPCDVRATVEPWPSRSRSSWSGCRTPASRSLTAALEQHRDTLSDVGVTAPAKSADEAFRAAVELRREHRAWGLRRKDVEGTWSAICRLALKQRHTVVVGHELLGRRHQ